MVVMTPKGKKAVCRIVRGEGLWGMQGGILGRKQFIWRKHIVKEEGRHALGE